MTQDGQIAYDPQKPLKGQVAFITGSTRGLGKGFALRLARDGANIVIHGRDAERAEETKKEIETLGVEAKIVLGDIAELTEIKRICKEALAAFGAIHILVNNAGIPHKGTFTGVNPNIIDRMIDVNIKAQLLISQQIIKKMRKNPKGIRGVRGRIINMSSTGGKTGKALKVLYDLTKFAMTGFTQALADELAPKGILVNALSPGIIDTPIWGPNGVNAVRDPKNEVPLQRFGTIEEVAEVCAFLVHPQNTYMTGQVLNVSGGREKH